MTLLPPLLACVEEAVVVVPVDQVVVWPSTIEVVEGDEAIVHAEARSSQWGILQGRDATWTVSPSSLGRVMGGRFHAERAGLGQLEARVEGVSGASSVTVFGQSNAPPGSGTLGVGFGTDQFALIPVGTFQMGSHNGWGDERPVHTVTITRPFLMQRTEVTQGQWREIMDSNPSHFSSCGEMCPVETVSWNEVQTFLHRLNQRYPGRNYRLPREAEWEYAARAGTMGDFGGTGKLIDMGWYRDNSGLRTHPVAWKPPNAWGLYDMHGNVWEKVQDWYGPYTASAQTNPTGPTTGLTRVFRGGSWHLGADHARAARRGQDAPSVRSSDRGFRLARTL